MLDIGIVGLKNATPYIDAIKRSSSFNFKGIYDPSLLIENTHTNEFNVFQSFGDLCGDCRAVIFSIDDNLYYPLVCEAIRHSLDVFVAGVQSYQTKELNSLLMLRDEAQTVVCIGHKYIGDDFFAMFRQQCDHPLDIQCHITRSSNNNLVSLARTELSLMLMLARASVHRVAVNVYSSFSSVPDSIRVRLDFDNGTVGNISIDRYGLNSEHTIRVLNYNSIVHADMIARNLMVISSENPDKPIVKGIESDGRTAAEIQLATFLSSMINCSELYNNLENEIRAQLACERIREKMRINFNVF
jgi:predicted dehydrogenase